MLFFKYSKFDGVLNYLYKKNPSQYWNEVTVEASEPRDDTPPSAAIDKNFSSWFVSKTDASPNNTFTLCFTNYFLYLTKYEIQTSTFDCISKGWRISASNDEVNWEYPTDVNFEFQSGQSKEFDYNHEGFFQCFQIMNTVISACNNYRFDLMELELFGYLIKKSPSQCKCTQYSPLKRIYYSLFLISLSFS